jgi:glycine cleavage system H protein
VDANAIIGEIESTKTTSTLEAPVSGRIIEVNDNLEETPEIINDEPYKGGWIAVIEMSDPKEVMDLMDSKAYQDLIEKESK